MVADRLSPLPAAGKAEKNDLIWSYTTGGRWTQVPDPIPWGDGDPTTFLRRAGFLPLDNFGCPDSGGRFSFELYENPRAGTYLVGISICSAGSFVLVETLPGLLELLGVLLSLVNAESACSQAEEKRRDRLRAALPAAARGGRKPRPAG
jgi:hypothetical protein